MSLTISYVPIDQIRPYEGNPRRVDPALPALVQSLLRFGWRIPLVVDSNMVLVCGHARLAAAKKILEEHPERAEEFSRVPVIVASDLDEHQIKAFRLVDNKVASLASWDFDMLAREVAQLPEFDLVEFGWQKEELDCLASVVEAEEEPIRLESSRPERRAKETIPVKVGRIAFEVDAAAYEAWWNEINQRHQWDPRVVADEVARMLGLAHAKRR